jgi:uncharacterized membrane protein YtjA (UPF0391 family)
VLAVVFGALGNERAAFISAEFAQLFLAVFLVLFLVSLMLGYRA